MPPVRGADDGTGYGVAGVSTSGYGVRGFSSSSTGVRGFSTSGYGVWGESSNSIGVYGWSYGESSKAGVWGDSHTGPGVKGVSTSGRSPGVKGESNSFFGVYGRSGSQAGVAGDSLSGPGVFGFSTWGVGVDGQSHGLYAVRGSGREGAVGVEGSSDRNYGVKGQSVGMAGVAGYSTRGEGVYGKSFDYIGVYGESSVNPGVLGRSVNGTGVYGASSNYPGVVGRSDTGPGLCGISGIGLAALLDGNVEITGNLRIIGTTIKEGGGAFRIDHPLDPANKYLSHSFVESPDMKNVYDGVVVLDDKGEAEIELPHWFGALNKDFRYQLTAIGAPGPNLYISEEISDATTTNYSRTRSNKNKNNNSRFKVAGGASGMKVSWQVTGIRKDPWANAHRISVEEDKPAKERGYYTYPELYGQPEEKGISHLLVPEIERKSCCS
jgi:hypothetical protein